MSRFSPIGRAAGWTARHPRAGPVAWGLAAAVIAPLTLIGGSVPGYIVGSARLGPTGLLLSAGAFVIAFVTLLALVVSSAMSSCPSCVDALIGAPFAAALYLVPFVIGYWLGCRARHPADPWT